MGLVHVICISMPLMSQAVTEFAIPVAVSMMVVDVPTANSTPSAVVWMAA